MPAPVARAHVCAKGSIAKLDDIVLVVFAYVLGQRHAAQLPECQCPVARFEEARAWRGAPVRVREEPTSVPRDDRLAHHDAPPDFTRGNAAVWNLVRVQLHHPDAVVLLQLLAATKEAVLLAIAQRRSALAPCPAETVVGTYPDLRVERPHRPLAVRICDQHLSPRVALVSARRQNTIVIRVLSVSAAGVVRHPQASRLLGHRHGRNAREHTVRFRMTLVNRHNDRRRPHEGNRTNHR